MPWNPPLELDIDVDIELLRTVSDKTDEVEIKYSETSGLSREEIHEKLKNEEGFEEKDFETDFRIEGCTLEQIRDFMADEVKKTKKVCTVLVVILTVVFVCLYVLGMNLKNEVLSTTADIATIMGFSVVLLSKVMGNVFDIYFQIKKIHRQSYITVRSPLPGFAA